MTRILGLDIGDKRIGVAVSDLLGLTAQGVETIFTKGTERDLARVRELAAQYETTRIVAGLPRLMSGEEGEQARKARAFADRLTEMGYEVRFVDERLTSVSAERVLTTAGVRREDRRKVVDKLAATYILQSFMDMGGWKEESAPTPETDEGVIYKMIERENEGYMEQDDIVTLVDEDGKELNFEHLMTLDYSGKTYVVLAPAEEMDDIEQDEAVVLRIEQDADGNDTYASITDEEELEKVFERYLEIAGEEDEEQNNEE